MTMQPQSAENESLVVYLLRSLAAFVVVIFHSRVDLWQGWWALSRSEHVDPFARAMSYLSIPAAFGGCGVMLFFVLSGYCIALPYAGPTGRPFRWVEYLCRRFFRIYPPYLAAIVLCAVIVLWARATGHTTLAGSRGYLSSVLMAQNYTTGQIELNPSLWSLPVEMEMYLVFPFFYFGLRRLGAPWMWIASAVVTGAGLALYASGWTAAAFNFAKFWLIWWSGAMLAENRAAGRLGSPGPLSLAVGGVAFAVSFFGTFKGWDASWLHLPYGVGFYVLLWLMLARENQLAPRLRFAAPLIVGAGTISYSLYLVHFPLLRVLGVLWEDHWGAKPLNFIWAILAILPVTLCAILFYRLVERPSHDWAKRLARASRTRA